MLLQWRLNRPFPSTRVTSSLAMIRAHPLQFRKRTLRHTPHPVICLTTRSCWRSVCPKVTLWSVLSLVHLLRSQRKKRWRHPSANIGRIGYRLLRNLKTNYPTRMRAKILSNLSRRPLLTIEVNPSEPTPIRPVAKATYRQWLDSGKNLLAVISLSTVASTANQSCRQWLWWKTTTFSTIRSLLSRDWSRQVQLLPCVIPWAPIITNWARSCRSTCAQTSSHQSEILWRMCRGIVTSFRIRLSKFLDPT